MSLETIIDVLVTVTSTVPDIGRVHAYQRIHVDPHQEPHVVIANAHETFGIDDQAFARGWSVRTWQWFRRGNLNQHGDLSGYSFLRTHQLRCQGWWEIDDGHASEIAWRTATEDLVAALSSSAMLGDNAIICKAPQVLFEGHGFLLEDEELFPCHVVDISLDVVEVFDTGSQAP